MGKDRLKQRVTTNSEKGEKIQYNCQGRGWLSTYVIVNPIDVYRTIAFRPYHLLRCFCLRVKVTNY